jgi:formylglycine-generating enzyme required for sulfatase activity
MKPHYLSLILAGLTALGAQAQQTNQFYEAEINWALGAFASQSSTLSPGTADRAVDGGTDGNWANNSVSHSGGIALDGDPPDPYWEVDLGTSQPIGAVHVWFRTDCCDLRNDDFSLVIYNANRDEVWRRAYPGRPPRDAQNGLHILYNLSSEVQGQYVRFVPQNPPTTSDGNFSLAEVQVLAPYQGVTANVSQSPMATSVLQGRRATFGPVSATVVGAPQDRLTYQWLRNGEEIPGANGTTYTTGIQSLADNASEYSVRCGVSGGGTLTAKAVLTVTSDTTAPQIEQVSFGSGPTLLATLRFNEVLDEGTAVQTANYSFGAGVSVQGAALSPVLIDPNDQHVYQTVTLNVVGLAQNVPYSLAVSGVKDFAGNTIAPVTMTGSTPLFEINLAMSGTATQSSTAVGGEPEHAIDGNTSGFFSSGSVTLNALAEDPGWWEVDLGTTQSIGRLKVWFRTLTADECQALFNSCAVRNDNFTLSVLDLNRNVVWTQTYPGRPPLQVAYNLPPGVTGQYVRFESQTPLTTSDGFFSLAEVQVIAPYQNVSLAVSTDLSPTASATENRRLTLGPVVASLAGGAGAPADVLSYQWQENGVDISGANAAVYQTPALALTQSGVRYRCLVRVSGQQIASTETTVTVDKDTAAPTVKSVVAGNSYTDITVVFSEPVSEASAGSLANYALSDGLEITEVVILSPTSVRLTTSGQTPGATYTLKLNGIRDVAAGAGNPIAADTLFRFTAPQSDASRYIVIGNPGNPQDTVWNTARGSVGYTFEISKFKVTNADYAAFLNAKAKSDPYNLMVSGGGEILREGEDGSYTYTVLEGRENRPVLFVAAVDAMRMANWLSNGGTEDSDTETGAYTFSGYDVVSRRNSNADYFLPNDDEWYKAAYYDPTKNGTGGYWQFPPKTDDPNQMVKELPPGGPYSANFDNVAAVNGNGTTDVGAYTAAVSHYGTYDQAGNTWEWNEPVDPTTKVTSRRGGSQGNAIARLAAGVIASNGINKGGASVNQGFRLARAHRIRLPLVTVGNPGNLKDTQWNTARGQVNYTYQISKYKVSNAEYAVFLNAKAKSDPYNLMVSGGGEIIREGEDGSYTYTVLEGRENRPVLFVAAVDAMRMANWLSNGGTESSDTETGSYIFSGYDVVSKRTLNASYVLPNDDEWYKAAYYDPTKNGTGGYWQFPPKTDDPNQMVSELPAGGPFSANFNNVAVSGENPNGTTDVGAYTAAVSHYGTYDQAGGTWEWNEPADPTTKVTSRRGGSQGNAVARLAAGVIASNGINKGGASVNQGFRLALVPPAPEAPQLTIVQLTATTIRISWTGSGTLEAASSTGGAWTAVANAGNPYLVNPTEAARYFRVRQ